MKVGAVGMTIPGLGRRLPLFRQVVVGLGRVAKAEMDSIRDTISRRPGDQEANKTIHYRLKKRFFKQ